MSLHQAVWSNRMSVNTKMEHRTLAWVLIITGTRVHLSDHELSQCLERIPSEKCSKSNLQTYLSANSGTWEQVFRWRSSPFPFPKLIFTLLKIPYPNRNHRRKLYSTKSAQSTVVPSLPAGMWSVKKRTFDTDKKKGIEQKIKTEKHF